MSIIVNIFMWEGEDLNLRRRDFQSPATTRLSYRPIVDNVGVAPTRACLQGKAIPPKVKPIALERGLEPRTRGYKSRALPVKLIQHRRRGRNRTDNLSLEGSHFSS